MTTSENSISQKLFLDYIPAELRENKSWMVVFYARIPGKEKLKRFRRRVPSLENKTERRKLAKRMCFGINNKLEKGWSPFYDGSAENNTRKLTDVIAKFIAQTERKCRDNLVRPDTLRAYSSYAKNLVAYMCSIEKIGLLCVEYDRAFIITFLDYLYYDKKRSARTANNYLFFCRKLGIFMFDRKYISSNPANKIEKRKVGKKKREVLPKHIRESIFQYQYSKSKEYLTLCMCIYFCFIRRTEITKLKVSQVNLSNNTIFIPAEVSKNKISGVVTIPAKLKSLLAEHINGSNESDFLFSSDDFKTGEKKLSPKKISDEWAKMRKVLNLESKYQFYSLKDTGITNLLLKGVPAKKVRDQARHHDIRITEKYTPEKTEADQTLLNLDFNF